MERDPLMALWGIYLYCTLEWQLGVSMYHCNLCWGVLIYSPIVVFCNLVQLQDSSHFLSCWMSKYSIDVSLVMM